MGDTNKAPRMLSKTGEGLFNPSRGDESKNQLFQGLVHNPRAARPAAAGPRREGRRSGLVSAAAGVRRRRAVARPPLASVLKRDARFTVPVGEPFTLADSESIVLARAPWRQRAPGRRSRRPGNPGPALAGCAALIPCRCPGAATPQSPSSTSSATRRPEDGLSVMEAAEATGARYARSALLEQTLRQLRRHGRGPNHGRRLQGTHPPAGAVRPAARPVAHAVRPLQPPDADKHRRPSCWPRSWRAAPKSASMSSSTPTAAHSVETRLGPDLLGELTLRVAGSAADQKDLGLVSGSYGDVPPLRTGQLLIGDPLKGTVRRARGYQVLTTAPGTQERETEDV